MKGRINFIKDAAEFSGVPMENIDLYLRVQENRPEDGYAVFDFHVDSGYIAGKVNGKMFAVLKNGERKEVYKWLPRKEAA